MENAGSKVYTKDDLGDLLNGVDFIYAARGKSIKHFDLRAGLPPVDELKGFVLGPTGNFRAPALRKGRTLVVGFNEAHLREIL